MISSRPKRLFVSLGGDLLSLAFSFLLSLYFFRDYKFSKKEWVVLSGFIFLWLLIRLWKKIIYSNSSTELKIGLYNNLKAYCAFLLLTFLFYVTFPIPSPNKTRIIMNVIGFPVLAVSLNFLLAKLISQFESTKANLKNTLVAGIGNTAKNVEKQLYAQNNSRHQIKGFISCMNNEECAVGQDRVVSNLNDIHQYLKVNIVDEIVIALPGTPSKEIKNIISAADYYGIRVKYIPDYQEVFGNHYKIKRYGQLDVVNVRQIPVDEKYSSYAKNSFDKIFSTIILILLSPLFLALAIMIKIDSSGPVFYCPIRIGKSGKAFKVYKFRSMRQNDESSGGMLSTQKHDPRVTRLGKILRKYSLDELPQFINVFLGDMSVVGPRPHRTFLNQQLQECVYKYMVRHYVKPGITGWAQVNGWRGPTDTEEQKMQRTLHDLWYLENWSLLLDIKIICLTIYSKKVHQSTF